MVVSRADDLHRLSDEPCEFYNREDVPVVLFDEAAAIIRELEEALAAEREASSGFESEAFRIAGIAEDKFKAEIAAARAEVPAWCKEFVSRLYYACASEDTDKHLGKFLATLVRLLDTDQFRACGIEP